MTYRTACTHTFTCPPTNQLITHIIKALLWTVDNHAAERHNTNTPLQAHHSSFNTNTITSPRPAAMLPSPARTHIPVSRVAHSHKGLLQNSAPDRFTHMGYRFDSFRSSGCNISRNTAVWLDTARSLQAQIRVMGRPDCSSSFAKYSTQEVSSCIISLCIPYRSFLLHPNYHILF